MQIIKLKNTKIKQNKKSFIIFIFFHIYQIDRYMDYFSKIFGYKLQQPKIQSSSDDDINDRLTDMINRRKENAKRIRDLLNEKSSSSFKSMSSSSPKKINGRFLLPAPPVKSSSSPKKINGRFLLPAPPVRLLLTAPPVKSSYSSLSSIKKSPKKPVKVDKKLINKCTIWKYLKEKYNHLDKDCENIPTAQEIELAKPKKAPKKPKEAKPKKAPKEPKEAKPKKTKEPKEVKPKKAPKEPKEAKPKKTKEPKEAKPKKAPKEPKEVKPKKTKEPKEAKPKKTKVTKEAKEAKPKKTKATKEAKEAKPKKTVKI